MRQILVKKTAALESTGGVLLLKAEQELTLLDHKPKSVSFSGAIQVLSGNPKFQFKLPKALAYSGVILLGAYHESDGSVTALLALLKGAGQLTIQEGNPVLIAESYDSDIIATIDSDRFSGGVVIINQEKTAPQSPPEPEPEQEKKPGRKKSKKR